MSFKPTSLQKKVKVRFWRLAKDNPMIDPAQVPASEVARMVGEPMVVEWWSDEAFRSWLLDSKTLSDKVTLGAEAAIDKLMEILAEPNVGPREAVTASNQVAAAKILLEMAGVAAPKRTEMTVKPDQLPDTEKELRKYLAENSRKLKILDAKVD